MIEEYTIHIAEEIINCRIIEETVDVSLNGDIHVITIPNLTTEKLTGLVNCENRDFYSTFDFVGLSTQVFLNGLKLARGIDYDEILPNRIHLFEAPSNIGFTDNLEIIYIKG